MTLIFDEGLVGYGLLRSFGLSSLDRQGFTPLYLLSALDCEGLAFLVLEEKDAEIPGFSDQEREMILTDLFPHEQRDGKEFRFFYIVTLHRDQEAFVLTANVKAPLVIDIKNKKGWQHILNFSSRTPQCSMPLLSSEITYKKALKKRKIS